MFSTQNFQFATCSIHILYYRKLKLRKVITRRPMTSRTYGLFLILSPTAEPISVKLRFREPGLWVLGSEHGALKTLDNICCGKISWLHVSQQWGQWERIDCNEILQRLRSQDSFITTVTMLHRAVLTVCFLACLTSPKSSDFPWYSSWRWIKLYVQT